MALKILVGQLLLRFTNFARHFIGRISSAQAWADCAMHPACRSSNISDACSPFDYHIDLEIDNELTPSTWKNREI